MRYEHHDPHFVKHSSVGVFRHQAYTDGRPPVYAIQIGKVDSFRAILTLEQIEELKTLLMYPDTWPVDLEFFDE